MMACTVSDSIKNLYINTGIPSNTAYAFCKDAATHVRFFSLYLIQSHSLVYTHPWQKAYQTYSYA